MAHIVVPVCVDTLEAARALDVMPQLIYVDASHEEEDVYNDIMRCIVLSDHVNLSDCTLTALMLQKYLACQWHSFQSQIIRILKNF